MQMRTLAGKAPALTRAERSRLRCAVTCGKRWRPLPTYLVDRDNNGNCLIDLFRLDRFKLIHIFSSMDKLVPKEKVASSVFMSANGLLPKLRNALLSVLTKFEIEVHQ
jgi:hypothetical protein